MADEGTFVQWNTGSRVAKKRPVGWVVAENGCHIWTGARDWDGYGTVNIDEKHRHIHRVRYEREVGPIPEGLQLDHFRCNNPSCCNPTHVRPVTVRENTLRSNAITSGQLARTHCPRGHELAGDNLQPFDLTRGRRSCRTCCNARSLADYHARRSRGEPRGTR